MFTQEQLSILNEYVKKIKILKTYNLVTNEPIGYKGKIINITPLFANTQIKNVTIDIPIRDSVKQEINYMVDNTASGSSTTNTIQYSTQILRCTIELDNKNIDWLLSSSSDIDSIATTFFSMIKDSYLQAQNIPKTIQSYIGKAF